MLLRNFCIVIAFFIPPLASLLWLGSKPSTRINLLIWILGLVVLFKLSVSIGFLIFLSSLLHSLWLLMFNVSSTGLKGKFVVTADIPKTDRSFILFHLGLIFTVLITAGMVFQGKVDSEKLERLDNMSIADGKLQFESCGMCHRLTHDNLVGPHLAGIVGRKAGLVEDYKYSRSLETASFIWTDENLIKFLQNPEEFLPRTRMAISPLSEKEASNVVSYLKSRQ